jgi:hypothetical protein
VHIAKLWGVLEGLRLARARDPCELNSCEVLFTNKDLEEKERKKNSSSRSKKRMYCIL